MDDLYIKITYPMNSPEGFHIDSNVKEGKISELLGEYLHGIVGAGKDESEPNILDVYEINLSIDLSTDTWSAGSNCGNKGLRDGIIMDVFKTLAR